MYLEELVVTFTTATANEDIFDTVIGPALTTRYGYTQAALDAGVFLNIRILFDADYSGNIVINGNTSKADAKTTLLFIGDVETVVISETSTSGEVKITT